MACNQTCPYNTLRGCVVREHGATCPLYNTITNKAGVCEYKEIKELYEYCQKIGVEAEIATLYDGFIIRFNNGGDAVQHYGSYGGDSGCVEFACDSKIDYQSCSLDNAKRFVRRNKDKLNNDVRSVRVPLPDADDIAEFRARKRCDVDEVEYD